MSQYSTTLNRYLITVSLYIYSPDDEAAVTEAVTFIEELNRKNDCKASVESITEARFGSIGEGRKVDT